jgi:DNA-directed RNA polymerase specialized sigma24 family protein
MTLSLEGVSQNKNLKIWRKKTMRTFNVNLDQDMNVLAVAFANGDQEAGAKFVEKIEPLMTKYAKKQYSPMEKEDLAQEFMLVAIQKAYDFAKRYNDGKNNVLGLIYTACKRRLIDINKALGAEKRSLYKDREVSLQALVGEDGDMSMSEKVASEQKSVEDLVVEKLNEKALSGVVKDFVASTKGRNSKIVPLIYKANKDDWSEDQLKKAIAKVLEAETGTKPNNEAIRQAKSRAIKSLRKSIESGNISFANQLEFVL